MKEEKMEERIIAYLLGECDEEEASSSSHSPNRYAMILSSIFSSFMR